MPEVRPLFAAGRRVDGCLLLVLCQLVSFAVTKSRKQKNSNVGEIGPKCSQATADAIHASDDAEFLPPYGCPYPAGSGAKVEWLRERQQRFFNHLVPNKKFAKRQRTNDNTPKPPTADQADLLFWNPADNPQTIPRPAEIMGHAYTVRQIITTLHTQE